MDDLAQQAARSAQIRDDPVAQEEYHRKIMAEEPTYEQESELFKEALMDPQKAREFWNQEYLEKQKQDLAAMEQSLDQKMKEIQQLLSSPASRGVKGRSQQRKVGANTRDMYFSTADEGKKFTEMIENGKIDRAMRIAAFYDGKDSDLYDDVSQNGSRDVSLSSDDPNV